MAELDAGQRSRARAAPMRSRDATPPRLARFDFREGCNQSDSTVHAVSPRGSSALELGRFFELVGPRSEACRLPSEIICLEVERELHPVVRALRTSKTTLGEGPIVAFGAGRRETPARAEAALLSGAVLPEGVEGDPALQCRRSASRAASGCSTGICGSGLIRSAVPRDAPEAIQPARLTPSNWKKGESRALVQARLGRADRVIGLGCFQAVGKCAAAASTWVYSSRHRGLDDAPPALRPAPRSSARRPGCARRRHAGGRVLLRACATGPRPAKSCVSTRSHGAFLPQNLVHRTFCNPRTTRPAGPHNPRKASLRRACSSGAVTSS